MIRGVIKNRIIREGLIIPRCSNPKDNNFMTFMTRVTILNAPIFVTFFCFQYRVVLNGFGYALFGVPDRDLNRTWRNGNTINSIPGQLPLLSESPSMRQTVTENHALKNLLYKVAKKLPRARRTKVKYFQNFETIPDSVIIFDIWWFENWNIHF